MQVTDEDIELAKAAINLENFRLMEGMICFITSKYGYVQNVIVLNGESWFCRETTKPNSTSTLYRIMLSPGTISEQVYPLLRAPSTRGCLLELVKRAWNLNKGLSCMYNPKTNTWDVSLWIPSRDSWAHIASGPTEERALLNALEAATVE